MDNRVPRCAPTKFHVVQDVIHGRMHSMEYDSYIQLHRRIVLICDGSQQKGVQAH